MISQSGEVALTYDVLLNRLAADAYSPVLRPANTAEAFIGVLTAIVRGLPMRLVDSDFSANELRLLGIEESHLRERIHLSPAPSINITDAYAIARESSGFSLELYTSGSTGLPKLVRHRFSSLTRTLRVNARHAGDVWALAYNPTHIAGIQVLLQAFFNGNTLVDVFGLSRMEIYHRLREQAVTHISATPTFYRLIMPPDGDVPTLRSLTLGGERADRALLAQIGSAFPLAKRHNLYASTEAGTLLVSDGDAFGIHPAVEGKVIIREGQIFVAKELLAEFEGLTCEKWYSTGDRVEIISDFPLRFRIIGRCNDFINVGGAKVDPAEVESVIRMFPGITEARAFGRPNSVVGTILCAEYSSSVSVAEVDLRLHLASHLQPHKIPRMIKKVDFISKTRTGKLSRNV